MPSTMPILKVDCQQEKDDRLVILLGIGVLLFFIYCSQQFNIPLSPSHKYFKLQWKWTLLVIDGTENSPFPETEGDPVYDASIPAALTPFFFAPLPINEADQQLLETLSGIGPHLASEIIKTRLQQGSFHNPEDLLHIRGIGQKRMLKFADQFSYR
jgi:competence ComEA-like helix-hairpin-helix protein